MRQIYTYFTAFLLFLFLASSGMGQTNLLTNGDLETITPNYWVKMGGDAEMTWATDTAAATFNSRRSFKITKASVSGAAMGWKSVNNADLYWNNAGSGAYTLNFSAKTEGVNTSPSTDDAKIGVIFRFLASSVELGSKLVAVDQSITNTSWTSYSDVLLLSGEPDEVYAELVMGKDATGTVWFDNIDCNTSDTWTMGIFNGDAEIPAGWLNWASADDIGFANFVEDTAAHSGDFSTLLEESDSNGDEMVFYSDPVAAEAGKWYRVSVWAKTEGINTGDDMVAGSTKEFVGNRLGVNFFFHKAPINTSWELTGGDQFMYFSQLTGKENEGWTQYNVIAQAPEDAGGVSMRARFNPIAEGKVWYDDFSIEELETDPELLTNGDIETVAPNFWEKMGGDTEMTWATDTAAATFNSRRSFKITKASVSGAAMGWKTVNNADLYWNNAGSGAYTLNFSAKTEGVNTSPSTDDAKIGVMFRFLASSVELGSKLVAVDQSTANTNWTTYSDVLLLSGEPDEVYAELIMGKDATGTVWFDNIDCNTSDSWTMGIFAGDAEIPEGWMNWASADDIGFANFVEDTAAHSGDYSALLQESDGNGDEMVFYSNPVEAEAGKWYKISVWAKTEGINTGDSLVASSAIPDFREDRLGVNFFFHKAPINTSWELTGGDQFMYLNQLTGKENEGWTQYNVIAQAPEDAGGVSMRARFNPTAEGKVWYDDFSIQPVNVVISALETPQNSIILTPSDFKLKNNYPNPFNPETIIEYVVPSKGQVQINIYNLLGQKIRTLVNAVQSAGTYKVYWNGKNDAGNTLSSGVYFYQLQGENALITKKMTFIK